MPEGLEVGATAVAFSPTAECWRLPFPKVPIRLWEVGAWKVQHEFQGHGDLPTVPPFAPEGRLLSGSVDTTVLAWNSLPPRTTAGSLENAWTALAKHENGEAYKAVERFLAAPPEAFKFFASKIKPVQTLEAKQIQQLFADLDSNSPVAGKGIGVWAQPRDRRPVARGVS